MIEHDQPIIAGDIVSDARLKGKTQLQLGLRSCALLPLKIHEDVRGVIHIASRTLGFFHEEEKDHWMAIATQMSITLENRELFYDLRSSRDELQRANRVKDQFLSVISHELRTPLNLVIGYADTIRLGIFGKVNLEQTTVLEKLLHYGKELLAVITSVLYATDLGANEVQTTCDEFCLSELLGDLETRFANDDLQQRRLKWDYAADLPVMQTDRTKLDHILRSLIANAIKFTPIGQVTVSTRVNKETIQWDKDSDLPDNRVHQTSVEFNVTDTGIGISPEKLPRIFDMFSQGDSSAARGYEGIGLGLYLAKHFTDLLGGTIEVETVAHQGSTFTVKVPCVLNSSTRQGRFIKDGHEPSFGDSISGLARGPLEER